MIKGVRWHFVVLFVTTSSWVTLSVNAKHREKRQMRNIYFPPTLRNERYLPPIPIRVPPPFPKQSESSRRGHVERQQSPWIPMQSNTREEQNDKNVYVPPIHPPVITATRTPPKATFDIPLTKSIQVSPGKPKIQTTGHIRKKLVKIHATRTTTESPRQEMSGTLAESTVQTLLNFTPANEGWRPKSIPTTTAPNSNFGRNLGFRVNKLLNYTGVRYRKNNTVLKTMPLNGQAVRLSKNETNFVMKFTPEDIKYTSVEIKTEGIQKPFSVDSPEIQHLTGGFDERRPFHEGVSDHLTRITYKTADDLRNEGNVPYQGHKASMENIPSIGKNPLNIKPKDHNEDRNTFTLSHAKVKKVRLPGQESFVNTPIRPAKAKSPFTVSIKNTSQKDQSFVDTPIDSLNIKNDEISKQVSKDNRNFFSQSSNGYELNSQQQVKSNLPYQGHTTNPLVPRKADFQSKNSQPNREQQNLFPSPPRNQEIKLEEKDIYPPNDEKALPAYSVINNHQRVPINSVNAQLFNNKDSLNTAIRNDKSSASNGVVEDTAKNNYAINDPQNKNFKNQNSHNYAYTYPIRVIITHEDTNNNNDGSNNFSKEDQLSSKPALGEDSGLKEVELKNPPTYLQFHDEDFLKPVAPLNYVKYADKSLGSGDRIKETDKQELDSSRNKVNHLKTQISNSKAEYYENSKSEENKHLEDTLDNTYFQLVFPDTSVTKSPDNSQQILKNDLSSEEIEKDSPRVNVVGENSNPPLNEKAKENYISILQKISKDVIITKDSHFSPKDTMRNSVQQREDFPRIVTPPPVITLSYDSSELQNDQSKKRGPNRTENYAIHLKPVLQPETSGRPKKPKVTISTGMLAGILIAALVFLGFLTGSIVYAFHQWKFGRKKSDRQKKKSRSPNFPPEYLDDNLAGNTYIHNNIFLPTPQNIEERNPSDPDNSSMIGEEEQQQQQQQATISARGRRHRRTDVARREC